MGKKKKRRRPKAGPPPGQRPDLGAGTEEKKSEKQSAKGPSAPVKAGYRGSLIRAVLVAVLFYPYLVYLAGEDPTTALLISLGAFALMLPAGIALDRIRYRIQMRRYRQDLEGSKAE